MRRKYKKILKNKLENKSRLHVEQLTMKSSCQHQHIHGQSNSASYNVSPFYVIYHQNRIAIPMSDSMTRMHIYFLEI